MRTGPILCLSLMCAALLPSAAPAGTPYEEEMTCPIGGEKFEHTATASYSTFGSRPDGKPYGSWTFPMPLPVCPSSGLPIYAKFTKEQIARLTPMVASAEFKATAADTPYYRAAWLMERAGDRPADDIAWMVLQASWEADEKPDLKRKYQQEYVAKLAALPKGKDLTDWLWLQARLANGQRELGRFAESAATIDALLPQANEALEKAKAVGDAKSDEVRGAEFLVEFLKDLRAVSAAGNSSSQPVAMLPPQIARAFCKEGRAELNEIDRAACEDIR